VSGAKELFDDGGGDPVLDSGAAEAPRDRRSNTGHRPSDKNPPAPTASGLKFWIELVKQQGESFAKVTDSRTFRSGEKIRLHFESNREGRIAIVQLGTSGTSSVLFPDPSKGLSDNSMRAREDRVLPSAKHWFRFDDTAGVERLLVLFARDQALLDGLVPAVQLDPAQTDRLRYAADQPTGSKDLFIESVGDETYAANQKGGLVVLELTLTHR
jgi:hypothetical protein